ncbi:hypothetical protein BUUB107078_23680 [Burkholderia ubonensis]|nr:hypothetical protein BUB20358_02849 [Burkholderia ubonensis]
MDLFDKQTFPDRSNISNCLNKAYPKESIVNTDLARSGRMMRLHQA